MNDCILFAEKFLFNIRKVIFTFIIEWKISSTLHFNIFVYSSTHSLICDSSISSIFCVRREGRNHKFRNWSSKDEPRAKKNRIIRAQKQRQHKYGKMLTITMFLAKREGKKPRARWNVGTERTCRGPIPETKRELKWRAKRRARRRRRGRWWS